MFSAQNAFSDNWDTISSNVVHLIGETHSNQKCINLRNDLKGLSESEKILLALEGVTFNDEGLVKNLSRFGLEDEYALALSGTILYYGKLAHYKVANEVKALNNANLDGDVSEKLSEIADWYKAVFSDPSYRISQMKAICAKLGQKLETRSTRNKPLIDKCFDLSLLQSSDPKAYSLRLKNLTKNDSVENPFFLNFHANISEWINLYEDIINLSIERLKDSETLSPNILEDFRNYMMASRMNIDADLAAMSTRERLSRLEFWDDSTLDSLFRELILHERNKIFLANILKIIESRNSEEKKFYVIVGSAHAPFLQRELRQRGYIIKYIDCAYGDYTNEL